MGKRLFSTQLPLPEGELLKVTVPEKSPESLVSISGTITIKSEMGPDYCIIDCNGLGRGFIFEGTESTSAPELDPCFPDSRSVVDGFTIRNGSADRGGGLLYVDSAAPTVRNCIIKHCTADFGGGVALLPGQVGLESERRLQRLLPGF